jgi:hypothetical protein
MTARNTHAVPILTVHHGGGDSIEPAHTAQEVDHAQHVAHDALMRLSLLLPDSDHLRKSAVLLARSIRIRQSQARLDSSRPQAELD